MAEKNVINVLRFSGGEQITFGKDRTKYLLQMPGEQLRINISGVIWKSRTMKMPFETYKKRYLTEKRK